MRTQSKRKMNTLAGAAALLFASVVLAGAPSQENDSAGKDHDPLVGTWVVDVTPRGRPPFTAISSFNMGGTFAQIDTNSGVTSALGRWDRIDDLTYTNDFILFSDPYVSTTTVHVDLRLSATRDSFIATYEFVQVAPDGTVLVTGGGSRQGSRFAP